MILGLTRCFRTMLTLIIALATGIAIISAVWWFSPLRRWTSTFQQRSPGCSLSDLSTAYRVRGERVRAIADVRQNSRLVREEPGIELWSTPSGEWWAPKGHSPFLLEVVAEMGCSVYSTRQAEVRTGDVVLDCGAHVGCFTSQALKLGASVVVAIEMEPKYLDCLRRNLASEIASGRVIVYPGGVWDHNKTMPLDDILAIESAGPDSPSASPGQPAAIQVKLTTIDDLVQELGLRQVDFIKMDIEGAEVRALMGAAQTLARSRPRMAIAGYHYRNDCETIPAAVRQALPAYQSEFGPWYSTRGIRPETIFFHA